MEKTYYKTIETRQYCRTNRETGEVDIVTVSYRNNMTEEEQINLLNLNDKRYTYSI